MCLRCTGLAASIGIFHEVPNMLSMLGAAVICLGTLVVALSEAWQPNQQPRVGAPVLKCSCQIASSMPAGGSIKGVLQL